MVQLLIKLLSLSLKGLGSTAVDFRICKKTSTFKVALTTLYFIQLPFELLVLLFLNIVRLLDKDLSNKLAKRYYEAFIFHASILLGMNEIIVSICSHAIVETGHFSSKGFWKRRSLFGMWHGKTNIKYLSFSSNKVPSNEGIGSYAAYLTPLASYIDYIRFWDEHYVSTYLDPQFIDGSGTITEDSWLSWFGGSTNLADAHSTLVLNVSDTIYHSVFYPRFYYLLSFLPCAWFFKKSSKLSFFKKLPAFVLYILCVPFLLLVNSIFYETHKHYYYTNPAYMELVGNFYPATIATNFHK